MMNFSWRIIRHAQRAQCTKKYGGNKKNFKKFNGKWKWNKKQKSFGQSKGKGHFKKDDQSTNSEICRRCGCTNHRTSKCSTPKHLADLYLKSTGKSKQVYGKAEAHFNALQQQENLEASTSQSAPKETRQKDEDLLDVDNMMVEYTQDAYGDLI